MINGADLFNPFFGCWDIIISALWATMPVQMTTRGLPELSMLWTNYANFYMCAFINHL